MVIQSSCVPTGRIAMKVSELCRRDVVTVRPFDDLATAARIMRERHVGYLVVVEPNLQEAGLVPIGVLTDRDIVVSVVAPEVDPRSLRVCDVMTPQPVTALAEDCLKDALERMEHSGIRRLPIVGEYGALVGVLALDDVLRNLASELGSAAGAISREIMAESTKRM
jgi:predicted transcriptional regulator